MFADRDKPALEEPNPYRTSSRPSREVSPYLLAPLRSLEDAMRARKRCRSLLRIETEDPAAPQQLAS